MREDIFESEPIEENMPQNNNAPMDLREHLAAERTALAYVRTGLALMGFGFVVARFGFFLREIQAVHANTVVHSPGLSSWLGTALVLLGVLVSILAARQYAQQVHRLNQISPPGHPVSYIAIGVSLLLAAIGIAMAGYLLAQ